MGCLGWCWADGLLRCIWIYRKLSAWGLRIEANSCPYLSGWADERTVEVVSHIYRCVCRWCVCVRVGSGVRATEKLCDIMKRSSKRKASWLFNNTRTHARNIELKKEIEECYTKVCLKNITIRTSSPWLLGRGERCFRIHCSILNKNDNLINGEQSDVISLLLQVLL